MQSIWFNLVCGKKIANSQHFSYRIDGTRASFNKFLVGIAIEESITQMVIISTSLEKSRANYVQKPNNRKLYTLCALWAVMLKRSRQFWLLSFVYCWWGLWKVLHSLYDLQVSALCLFLLLLLWLEKKRKSNNKTWAFFTLSRPNRQLLPIEMRLCVLFIVHCIAPLARNEFYEFA